MNSINKRKYLAYGAIILSSAGTLASVYLSSKATLKAHEILKEEHLLNASIKTKAKKVWKCYISTSLAVGATLLTNVISGTCLNWMANEAILSGAIGYIGTKVSKSLKDPNKNKIIDLNIENGDDFLDERRLFWDFNTLSYFTSTFRHVLNAERLTIQALEEGASDDFYITVGEFYDFLLDEDCDLTGYIQDVCFEDPADNCQLAWYKNKMDIDYLTDGLRFVHRKIILDDGMECILIEPNIEPI